MNWLAVLALAAPAAGGNQAAKLALTLPVVPGAVDTVRRVTVAIPSVEYEVRESYPAPRTIAQLVDAMSKAGWKLAGVGGFKASWPQPSDMPASGFGELRDSATHFWVGRWQGPGGYEAVFRLWYRCPMEAAGMHSVWVRVWGGIYGPEEAAREQAWRKRIREECRAGKTVSPECEE